MDRMSLSEKETVMDEIYVQQPNLLASILVQQKLGNTLEQMDVLLNLLLVIHLALKKSGVRLETISEDEQEQQLRRFIAKVNFTEGLDAVSYEKALQQSIEHEEQLLFAYAHRVVMDAGFVYLQHENSKYLTMCALNLVNCVAAAKEKSISTVN